MQGLEGETNGNVDKLIKYLLINYLFILKQCNFQLLFDLSSVWR